MLIFIIVLLLIILYLIYIYNKKIDRNDEDIFVKEIISSLENDIFSWNYNIDDKNIKTFYQKDGISFKIHMNRIRIMEPIFYTLNMRNTIKILLAVKKYHAKVLKTKIKEAEHEVC